MNIHKSQLFWGSLGTRVLTHPHIDANSNRIAPVFGASNALNRPGGPLRLVARRLARLDHWK